MTANEKRAKAGGAMLKQLMARRALSAPRLSKLTGAEVSPTSIRSYVSGASAPQVAKARAVAMAIGGEAGAALLRAWELDDLAEGLIEAEAEASRAMTFPAPPTAPARSSRVGSRLGLTVVRSDEDLGVRLLVGADEDGTLYVVIPLASD